MNYFSAEEWLKLCFTVEIDKKRFPNVEEFIEQLASSNVLYMSNEFDISQNIADAKCYRFEFDDKYRTTVCKLLTELIKNDYLKLYADNIIDVNYFGFDKSEKCRLIEEIVKSADADSIAANVNEFLTKNKHIHLGGFALFRMRKFISEFEDEIDFAVDEYLQKQQYDEFVKFLKFFVSMQEPEFDEVNLVIKGRNYTLLNANGEKIDKKLLDSTYCEFADFEDNEYIMLNDLISLSPIHITVHCSPDDAIGEPVNIIKEIFGSRVDFMYI